MQALAEEDIVFSLRFATRRLISGAQCPHSLVVSAREQSCAKAIQCNAWLGRYPGFRLLGFYEPPDKDHARGYYSDKQDLKLSSMVKVVWA